MVAAGQRLGAGKVQMGVDLVIVLATLMVVPPVRVAQSVEGTVAIGALLVLNHRPGLPLTPELRKESRSPV